MNYLDWNNHIAGLFFKPENAGNDIHFYLTKQDLIKYSFPMFDGESPDAVWTDFIHAITYGEQEENDFTFAYSPIKRPLELYANWDKTGTPPFIAYLILYIIPLTETYDKNFSTANYYGKVNEFFKQNGIIKKVAEEIETQNFRKISFLWDALEEWSIMTKNCDLGIFELKKFGNPNWIYVGKPLSQCILNPRAINKLPEFFYEANLIPNSFYSQLEISKLLLYHGSKVLGLTPGILKLVREHESNELGQSIIDIVIREYNKWTGETHEDEESGPSQRTKRNYTVAPLFLQFKVNLNDGLISFSYRAYSTNDYPEDLKFGEYENLYELNGWSRTLNLEFQESFELKDDFNKWIAKFPDRDVRLFISAGTFQLSTGYWIETDSLSKTDPMYLLCRNGNRESIEEWGKSFHNGDFKMADLDGMPDNYSLFWLLNPMSNHPDIPLLTLSTKKGIELSGGKVNFRTFINDFLPEVEIKNSNGNERVYLQYRNTEEKIFLAHKQSNSNHWLLPSDTLLNIDFYIKVEDENLSGNERAYVLTSSDDTACKIDGIQLPKRDSFGQQITADIPQYCLGSNIVNPNLRSVRWTSFYAHLFTPINEQHVTSVSKATFNNHSGNMLCGFLALKNVLTTEEFFKAFEFYYSKEFSERHVTAGSNLTWKKKASLNFYDFTGILDYDYEAKKIVLNAPQLIFIPASQGRKVLLIGARDAALVNAIIIIAPKYNLQVEIARQFSSNEKLLLPDVLTIKAFGKSVENYGERNIVELSKELQIKFSNEYFPQVALQEFSSGISEYAHSKQLTDENDYGWARKIFNVENLTFERSETPTFDKSFSMIEYKLNEYTYRYKLWEDGKCYQVDKNWGKYLALKRFNKNVILFDSIRKRVAIPWEMPLPRLLSESIMLLSGFAPDFKKVDGKNYRVFENIPGIFTENLFHKLGQQPINTELK